jgi:hypothetical protein
MDRDEWENERNRGTSKPQKPKRQPPRDWHGEAAAEEAEKASHEQAHRLAELGRRNLAEARRRTEQQENAT